MKYYLAKTRQNFITYSEDFTQWNSVSSVFFNIQNVISPRLDYTAKVLVSSSDGAQIYCQPSSVDQSLQISFSVFFGKTTTASWFPYMQIYYDNTTSGTAEENNLLINTKTGATSVKHESKNGGYSVDDVGSFWRASLTCARSMDLSTHIYLGIYPAAEFFNAQSPGLGNGDVILWGSQLNLSSNVDPYLPTSGATTATSGDSIIIYPEYNYEITGRKIEDRKRARSGREYVYKWGQYEGRKFDVSYISDADKTKINSWWSGNDSLLFIDGITTAITSVRIQNDKTPISKLEKPYTNLWKGTIELETY